MRAAISLLALWASAALVTAAPANDVNKCKSVLGDVWEVEEFCFDWLHVKTQTMTRTVTVDRADTTKTQ